MVVKWSCRSHTAQLYIEVVFDINNLLCNHLQLDAPNVLGPRLQILLLISLVLLRYASSWQVTKLKLKQKQQEGIAEARSGRRSPVSVSSVFPALAIVVLHNLRHHLRMVSNMLKRLCNPMGYMSES